jgi:hypothetical protein
MAKTGFRRDIMAQPGPSDYREQTRNVGREDLSDGIMESARDISERAGSIAEEVVNAVRERPYTTLAVAAGLAFAIGAVWKLGQRPEPSRLDRLLAQLPDLRGRDRLERWWR